MCDRGGEYWEHGLDREGRCGGEHGYHQGRGEGAGGRGGAGWDGGGVGVGDWGSAWKGGRGGGDRVGRGGWEGDVEEYWLMEDEAGEAEDTTWEVRDV